MTPALIVDPSSMGGLVWTGGNPVDPLPVVVEPDPELVALVNAARAAVIAWRCGDLEGTSHGTDKMIALSFAVDAYDPKEKTDA